MAALAPLRVDCPVCDAPIDVPLELVLGAADRETNTVPATLVPDFAPISAHAATHQEA